MGVSDGVGIPLIVTDSNRVDEAAIDDYMLDMAFGSDEQSFEATFDVPRIAGGAFVYIDGTEYGGIVDGIRANTSSTDGITYTGRTWHGILAGKIVKPPSGSAYRTFTGDANAAIADIVSHVGLTSLFAARQTSSGIAVNYKYGRYVDAYSALKSMLASAGAVLCMSRHDGVVELWAERARTIGDELDSDAMDFESESAYRVTNHLVCLGKGEGAGRLVVDLYADAAGNVSRTQTFAGIHEIAEIYDYSSAEEQDLIDDGTEKLRDMQLAGSIEVDVQGETSWRIGDYVTGRNNQVGTSVTCAVSKKIVRVDTGVMTVKYEMGDARSTVAAQAERYEGAAIAAARQIAEAARIEAEYDAGAGIVIDPSTHVISAQEMTVQEITDILNS